MRPPADELPDLAPKRRAQRNGAISREQLDRLPPHAPEAEQGILGCVLLDPNNSMGVCIEQGVGPGWFYDLRNETIFDVMCDMYDARENIDVITLQQRLKDNHMLEQIGGIPYLSSMADAVPSAANLTYYIGIVKDKFIYRRMIRTCTDAISKIYEAEGDPEELVDRVEADIMDISRFRSASASSDIKTLVREAIGEFEAAWERNGVLSGISSGFPDLDRMTDGFQNGDMIVIAARPSVGKTSLALNIVEHVALTLRLPVGLFSLEMKDRALVKRMLASNARVSMSGIRDGIVSMEQAAPRLTLSAGRISRALIYIDDTSGIPLIELRAKARRMYQQYGVKLFVIDYLQLVTCVGSKRKHEGRQQEITEISAGIKGLAKELDVPIVVLCQLNRDIEREKFRKPRMSDLRESGAIEQDADIIGMLYKPGGEDDDGAYDESIPVNLLIAKQRNGPTGDVRLTFMKSYTRFESAAKITDEDVPQTNQTEMNV